MISRAPERIVSVCVEWQSQAPFFAEFLLRFNYIEKPEVQTMGVGLKERSFVLYYNPDFLKKLKNVQLKAVLLHEIMHVIHLSGDRMGSRDPQLSNIAQDIAINDMVEETSIGNVKLKLPKYVCRMGQVQKMGYKGEPIFEPIYDFLYEKADKITIVIPGSGGSGNCPNCGGTGKVPKDKDGKEKDQGGGSGSGDEEQKDCPACDGTGSQGENGKEAMSTTDNHGEQRPLKESEKAILEDIINNARSRSWGNVSGNIKQQVEDLLKTKEIPWRKKLAMILSRFVHEPGGVYENTWARRNRRSLPLPGIRKMSKKIVVSVDTSGSIGDNDIKKFFGQIEKIIKDYSCMTLIQWDTKVQSVDQYRRGGWKKIKIRGRGGTDVQDLYNYVNENLKKTSILVNFTDGYFDDARDYYGIPTIWAIVNNENFRSPWGKVLHIKDIDRRSGRI